MTDREFIVRVLGLFDRIDAHHDLLWHVNGDTVTFQVDCSDRFAWATGDYEPVTPDTVAELEQAAADLTAIDADQVGWTGELYAARRRGQRLQGAAYPLDERLWPLFDACGQDRPISLDNPARHPGSKDSW